MEMTCGHGCKPAVANLRAQGEEEAARDLVGRVVFFSGIFGLALIPMLQSACRPLLELLGASQENLQEAFEYYQVRSLAAPAVMIVAVGNGALRGYLDTTTPLIVAALALIVDYSIDTELVYPKDPDALAAAGAATVVSEWLSATLFLVRLRYNKPPIVPIFDLFPPWSEIAPVVQAGGQIFVRVILYQAVLALSCAAAARIGPLDIAAHQIALQLWLPLSFVTDSFGVAAQGLVADALGRDNLQRARDLADLLLKWGVAMGSLLVVVYTFLEYDDASFIPRFFTTEPAVLKKITPIIWLVATIQPINGFVNVGSGILQGAQDFAFQVKIMLVSAIMAASIFAVQAGDRGLEAVWETLVAFQVARAIGIAYRYRGWDFLQTCGAAGDGPRKDL